MNANILYFDLESAPLVVHTWGLRDLNVGLNQIVADPYVMGLAYKRNDGPTKWIDCWGPEGRSGFLERVAAQLDWADIATGWNSQGFDGPWLEGELLREGIDRPSPYKHLDLMRVARRNFRFPSYRLQYVSSSVLGLPGKHETGGHSLWVECMNGNPIARRRMARYAMNDVNLLPPIFTRFRPYFPANINFALLNGIEHLACQKCGRDDRLQSRGVAYTATLAYPQYRCGHCGGWTRDKRSVGGTKGVGA